MADYLLVKKAEKIINLLRGENSLGLDIGCGTGHHLHYISEKLEGSRLIGLDYSNRQISLTKGRYPNLLLIQGSMTDLAFKDHTFDFIYTINSLHHVKSRRGQIKTIKEACRTLKPNGLFIIHEMNVFNPLVRLYLNHIFPKTRNIDKGTEVWFDQKLLNTVEEFEVKRREYFTFIPDFCPEFLMPLFKTIEDILEMTFISKLGAHLMVVTQKRN